ncbi:DNA adenine methylase [Spiroplasma monobiae]|uniref:Site-specific DNA-methyltransferase (adenine-specific) n=1 Tax=Spiroplasma monobiae MQ-1 TaxID=1336748 RepID=A0A2K9LUN2_SPISQ|nr:Dam family site-specific DNA-(adenine-N6)-methyltransferase [Spiroplasma monobiae]AUM62758.1 DNA adenine methylase [Spiroplasma monobiae MQ-1]
MAKPILKWAGGKTQLIKVINNEFPKGYNKYFELFLGGGALVLYNENENALINDIDEEIINLYKCVRENYAKIIDNIELFRIEYNKNPKAFYYKLREYSDEDFSKDIFLNAARTLFLNKTCFNGLYRKNANNKFNVPWNKSEIAPQIYDIENIKKVSEYLNKIEITNESFEYFKNKIKKDDLVYLDPPYDKINKNTFESYNKDSFGKEGQIALRDFCNYIDGVGAYFIVSNHDTDFIKEIYKEYNIKIVKASRMINSKSENRGKINEVLIKNF